MTGSRGVRRAEPGAPALGGFAAGQLVRLCDVAGLDPADAETYARLMIESLGPVAERPLDRPPPSHSFLSDDHTPVEFSLAFLPDAAPTLRVLLEPGCGARDLRRNGRTGLRFIREMARRWNFAAGQLDELEDLFFPPSAEGPFALWCALELCPGGVPKAKVYLNPAAAGVERSAWTVREALRRLGHEKAFAALPRADGYPFFALDLGDWDAPRVKVYLRHDDLSAEEAGDLSRMNRGPGPAQIQGFFRTAAGFDGHAHGIEATGNGFGATGNGFGAAGYGFGAAGDGLGAGTDDLGTAVDGLGAGADGLGDGGGGPDARLGGRSALTCHAFTETATGLPSGFTLHIPVRDYVRHDGEALARAVTVLRRHGMDTAPLLQSLAAVTSRQPQDGVGLIAYLALAHQRGRPPRVTAYISSEAYTVRPPLAQLPHQGETVH
ncbi:tryptophan dimethylallyltransferase family protein [Streptomyces sp. NPDC002845]